MVSTERDTVQIKKTTCSRAESQGEKRNSNGFVGDHSMGFMLVADVWRAGAL